MVPRGLRIPSDAESRCESHQLGHERVSHVLLRALGPGQCWSKHLGGPQSSAPSDLCSALTQQSVEALISPPTGLIDRGPHTLKGKSAAVNVFGLDLAYDS